MEQAGPRETSVRTSDRVPLHHLVWGAISAVWGTEVLDAHSASQVRAALHVPSSPISDTLLPALDVVSYHVVSCRVILCHIVSYQVVSCHTVRKFSKYPFSSVKLFPPLCPDRILQVQPRDIHLEHWGLQAVRADLVVRHRRGGAPLPPRYVAGVLLLLLLSACDR